MLLGRTRLFVGADAFVHCDGCVGILRWARWCIAMGALVHCNGRVGALDRATRPVAPTFSACSFYQNDTIILVLTSHFPDLPFSANAHFRKIVPIRKRRVKYFKIHPSKRIRIKLYSHNYTVSNAEEAFFALLFTLESTGDWLRTDERLPSYRRVRTVVPTRPYENNHLSPFFRARRGTISDV